MRDYLGYEIVKISKDISEDKFKKAVRSGKITLNATELKGTKPILVHPMCAKIILRAQAKQKGVTSMMIAASDILYDLELHGDRSFWSWIHAMKNKKAYNWIWDGKESSDN